MFDNILYEQWIRFLFDRAETENPLNWEPSEFPATDEQKVCLAGQTFLKSGSDLAQYTDSQVCNGLRYIFDTGLSDISALICQKGVAEDLRINSVLAIKDLYRDCFFKRCTRTLSYIDEPGSSPLNSVCYMLWDISPLTRWKDIVIDVMEEALYLPHDACIESGLHGLGHRYNHDKIRVTETIDRFLSKTSGLRPELKIYANHARTGYVQ